MRTALLRTLLAGFSGLAFTGNAAMAGDLLPPPPPPPPAPIVYAPPPQVYQPLPLRPASYGWTGAYAGGFAGGVCADGTAKTFAKSKSDGLVAEPKDCFASGGLLAGYNYQSGDIVYGFETDFGLGGKMKDKGTLGGDTIVFQSDMNPMATLRGRVGYGMDSTLLSLTAGAGAVRSEVTMDDAKDANWHLGWVAGAGVEKRISENLSLRGEYLFGKFGEKSYSSACCGGTAEYDLNMFRLGLIWNFGGVVREEPPVFLPPPPYVGVGG